jgi:hypothetical protein
LQSCEFTGWIDGFRCESGRRWSNSYTYQLLFSKFGQPLSIIGLYFGHLTALTAFFSQNRARLQSTTLRNQFQLIEHKYKNRKGTPINLPSVSFTDLLGRHSVTFIEPSCFHSQKRPERLLPRLHLSIGVPAYHGSKIKMQTLWRQHYWLQV